jgi:hypothetical protein
MKPRRYVIPHHLHPPSTLNKPTQAFPDGHSSAIAVCKITWNSSQTHSFQFRSDPAIFEVYIVIPKIILRRAATGFIVGAVLVLALHALELSPLASIIGASSLAVAIMLARGQ